MNLSEVENASIDKLIKIVINLGFDLDDYGIGKKYML